MMDNLSLDFNLSDLQLKPIEPEKEEKQPELIETVELGKGSVNRHGLRKNAKEVQQELSVQALRLNNSQLKRRIKSELALDNILDWYFEKGDCWHCISFGDVDSLSYLRFILKQQKLEYVLLSTWCMSAVDICEIENWLMKGYIKRIDFYVGEIFTGTYYNEYALLIELCRSWGGRVCVFRNHSKVMAGFGEKFNFAIESSANINTNPRCENTVITIDDSIANFYKDFFDQIKSFERNFDEWQPYILGGKK